MEDLLNISGKKYAEYEFETESEKKTRHFNELAKIDSDRDKLLKQNASKNSLLDNRQKVLLLESIFFANESDVKEVANDEYKKEKELLKKKLEGNRGGAGQYIISIDSKTKLNYKKINKNNQAKVKKSENIEEDQAEIVTPEMLAKDIYQKLVFDDGAGAGSQISIRESIYEKILKADLKQIDDISEEDEVKVVLRDKAFRAYHTRLFNLYTNAQLLIGYDGPENKLQRDYSGNDIYDWTKFLQEKIDALVIKMEAYDSNNGNKLLKIDVAEKGDEVEKGTAYKAYAQLNILKKMYLNKEKIENAAEFVNLLTEDYYYYEKFFQNMKITTAGLREFKKFSDFYNRIINDNREEVRSESPVLEENEYYDKETVGRFQRRDRFESNEEMAERRDRLVSAPDKVTKEILKIEKARILSNENLEVVKKNLVDDQLVKDLNSIEIDADDFWEKVKSDVDITGIIENYYISHKLGQNAVEIYERYKEVGSFSTQDVKILSEIIQEKGIDARYYDDAIKKKVKKKSKSKNINKDDSKNDPFADESFESLVARLNSHWNINPGTEYTEFKNSVNDLLNYIKAKRTEENPFSIKDYTSLYQNAISKITKYQETHQGAISYHGRKRLKFAASFLRKLTKPDNFYDPSVYMKHIVDNVGEINIQFNTEEVVFDINKMTDEDNTHIGELTNKMFVAKKVDLAVFKVKSERDSVPFSAKYIKENAKLLNDSLVRANIRALYKCIEKYNLKSLKQEQIIGILAFNIAKKSQKDVLDFWDREIAPKMEETEKLKKKYEEERKKIDTISKEMEQIIINKKAEIGNKMNTFLGKGATPDEKKRIEKINNRIKNNNKKKKEFETEKKRIEEINDFKNYNVIKNLKDNIKSVEKDIDIISKKNEKRRKNIDDLRKTYVKEIGEIRKEVAIPMDSYCVYDANIKDVQSFFNKIVDTEIAKQNYAIITNNDVLRFVKEYKDAKNDDAKNKALGELSDTIIRLQIDAKKHIAENLMQYVSDYSVFNSDVTKINKEGPFGNYSLESGKIEMKTLDIDYSKTVSKDLYDAKKVLDIDLGEKAINLSEKMNIDYTEDITQKYYLVISQFEDYRKVTDTVNYLRLVKTYDVEKKNKNIEKLEKEIEDTNGELEQKKEKIEEYKKQLVEENNRIQKKLLKDYSDEIKKRDKDNIECNKLLDEYNKLVEQRDVVEKKRNNQIGIVNELGKQELFNLIPIVNVKYMHKWETEEIPNINKLLSDKLPVFWKTEGTKRDRVEALKQSIMKQMEKNWGDNKGHLNFGIMQDYVVAFCEILMNIEDAVRG